MSYPVIYRKRVIEYRKEGHTLEETGKTFKIAVSTIQRWENQLKEKGDLENKPLNRSFKKINPEKLKEYIKENSDSYIKETAEVFNCSTTAVIKAFKRLGITRKKKTTYYKEQNQDKIKKYLEEIKDIPEKDIVYIDETGIDQYLYREYAYSSKGEKIYAETSGRKYKRTSIVAAWTGHKIIAPLEYNGTMDSRLFEYWFAGMLLPGLQQGSTIVMDNAAFHRKTQLLSIAKEQGYRLIFLPPYSPELNPIEKFWSWLKRHLKKILPFFNSFDEALFECFQVI